MQDSRQLRHDVIWDRSFSKVRHDVNLKGRDERQVEVLLGFLNVEGELLDGGAVEIALSGATLHPNSLHSPICQNGSAERIDHLPPDAFHPLVWDS